MARRSTCFPKYERLCSAQKIRRLFQTGESFTIFPYKVFYLKEQKSSDTFSHQVIFVVSKKKIRSAVARNKVRRLSKEAYRLNKALLFNRLGLECGFVVLIGFMYVASYGVLAYEPFSNVISKSLKRIMSLV